jgi:hypothetical protein
LASSQSPLIKIGRVAGEEREEGYVQRERESGCIELRRLGDKELREVTWMI